MRKIFTIAIVIVLGIVIGLITSCDIVEEPYLVPVGGGTTPDTTQKIRKVLLEDYTGQECPNCPEAAEISHTLQAIYGEQLVVIAIHAGYYSEPDATGDFTADFRTTEGTALNHFFNIYLYGYPMGMVNRTEYDGFPVVTKDDWESAVGIQAEMDPQADISITNTYNDGTRKLDCTLETEFLEDLEGIYNICVFITESHIISPQQTADSVAHSYEHNHMLRGSMNGTWGDLVGTDGTAVSGTKLTNSYSITLPAEWVAENCAVVAFVYDTEDNEVVQAEEIEVVSR